MVLAAERNAFAIATNVSPSVCHDRVLYSNGKIYRRDFLCISGFQAGVRGPKGVRDGFPWGPREDSEK